MSIMKGLINREYRGLGYSLSRSTKCQFPISTSGRRRACKVHEATFGHISLPIRISLSVIGTLAELYSYAKLALSVLSWAAKKLGDVYGFITEDKRLQQISSMHRDYRSRTFSRFSAGVEPERIQARKQMVQFEGETLDLSGMACADGAGRDTRKQCYQGCARKSSSRSQAGSTAPETMFSVCPGYLASKQGQVNHCLHDY
ncbi:hypothetical protein EV424DRAFT_1351462 [Suillus variegatus]|nr:hypothetical protein EV424DRAFT_1351462 [Suillus variegatus]